MARFSKVLVANRGEIACRVIRSAQALGYRTVAVYSDADCEAPHVRLADEAVRLGPAPVGESYLSIERVLQAAGAVGADAIHPGYGFLAERADFAQACAWGGVTFVGPSPEAIEAMGDKARAKALAEQAGVPTVPGYRGEQDEAAFVAAAAEVGFPLLVKAAAGGGGRGMRRVDQASELPAALAAARAEAEHAFGDGTLLLERLVEGARHVEIQLLADEHGSALYLGERDCSVQRRYQKVIEEAPAPGVSPELRQQMGEAAASLAREIGYVGAGTVELLLAPDGSFMFLEMNTRLQVEHPVTELVTGLDLVAWQLRVAQGEPLPFSQEDVELVGHAIEARLYAEDPSADFLPQTGTLSCFAPPVGPGLRCDHGVKPGLVVSPHYDPMLAKVIAHGRDREEALRRLRRALRETGALGLVTNKGFLLEVLAHEPFVAGELSTRLLAEAPQLGQRVPPSAAHLALAAALGPEGPPAGDGLAGALAPLAGAALRKLRCGEVVYELGLQRLGAARWRIQAGDEVVELELLERNPSGRLWVEVEGVRRWAWASWDGDQVWVELDGRAYGFAAVRPRGLDEVEVAEGALVAPSDARVVSVAVAVGDEVEAGQVLVVLEAMKIEATLRAPRAGKVAELRAVAGEGVRRGAVLVQLEQEEES